MSKVAQSLDQEFRSIKESMKKEKKWIVSWVYRVGGIYRTLIRIADLWVRR